MSLLNCLNSAKIVAKKRRVLHWPNATRSDLYLMKILGRQKDFTLAVDVKENHTLPFNILFKINKLNSYSQVI